MKNPADGHMEGLRIVFVDDDHIQQIWTWSMKGKEKEETFKLKRVI